MKVNSLSGEPASNHLPDAKINQLNLQEQKNNSISAGKISPASQVHIENTIKSLLNSVMTLLNQQETLLDSLPSEIKEAFRNLFQQNFKHPEAIVRGMKHLLKAQRNTASYMPKIANAVVTSKAGQFPLASTMANITDSISSIDQQLMTGLFATNSNDFNVKSDNKILENLLKTFQKLHTAHEQINEAASYKTVGHAFSLGFPLYFEGCQKPYPVYLHVYSQKEENKDQASPNGKATAETWFRFCIATQNIGFVDLLFRCYQENLVNISVSFSDSKAATSFKQNVPSLREKFTASEINLTDIQINETGAEYEE